MSERLPATDSDGRAGRQAPAPAATSRLPVAVAGVVALAVVVAAVLFLGSDDGGRSVFPEQFTVTGARTFESSAPALSLTDCERVERVELDLTEDAVRVRWVVEGVDGCSPQARTEPVRVAVELDEDLRGRRLLGGIGTAGIPCRPDGTGFHCAAP